jgi:gliding motility-associated-like protein
MSIRLPLIPFTLFLALALPLASQNYTMNGSPVTDCNGSFFDPGGPSGNYPDNANLSTTICSDGSNGTHIRLSFSGADLVPGDMLCIYDGQNLTAPLLACHTDYNPGQPFLVQATATNPSGCLTISFDSDGSGVATGWAAAISCVASCQTILADLVSTNPAAVPVDTGWIDICPGERVFFDGKGIYPQNNFAYPQSDLTTTFEWNFGDGGIAYGPNTSHRFDNPGGYYVQLFLTDQQGCRNINLINQRVRVAPRPNFQLAGALNQTICAGDTINLSANVTGSAGNQTLLVTPNTAAFAAEGSRSDSLALPDGTGIPYKTSVFFSEFSPGQVMVSPTDLESLCVTMEHSWIRDVEITLTCPNGQSIILHDHPGNFGDEVFLGQPNDNDNVNPIPGLGYEYCWVNNAPNPTWIQFANALPGGVGTIPAGDYSTFQPISNLVGCPLNGEWTITVTDWWPIDNGFIFNWSLKFLDQLYPSIESFTPSLDSWHWNSNPSIFFSTADSIAASPQNAGTAGYTFTVNDAFGCSWDTLLTIAVLPPTHPNCFSCDPDMPLLKDTTICAGNAVQFDATALAPPMQEIRFESYPEYRLGNGNHPHANPYLAPVTVSSLGYLFLTIPTQQITSVCMDIETDFVADLNVFLRAPSGQLLELSSGNGGSGDNYKITCFSPVAATPIVGQSAPFNGAFAPEGNWSALNGAAINGNWSLRVSDGFAPNQFGTVKWWSIGFKVNNNTSYSWTNANTLSCSSCPNPTATPTQTSTYAVNTTDAFGCQHRDTVLVNVITSFPAPDNLTVTNLAATSITWGWDAVPGALGYEVSINGGAWQSPNGALMHTLSGLMLGESVMIEVRAISPGCTPLVAAGNATTASCTFSAALDSVVGLQCAGDSTGSAIISVLGANNPVQFFVDNWLPAFPDGNLQNILPGGNHRVIVRDALGCSDTLDFSIVSPAALVVGVDAFPINCPGDSTGAAMANAVGGTGNLTYAWQPCAGGATQTGANIGGLPAGCYAVTVTDGNGCTLSSSATITQPEPFTVSASQTPVSCFGGNNGTTTITVTGGTMPYNYAWDNNQTSMTATGLTAGPHFVIVTDANLCQVSSSVDVEQPPLLMVSSSSAQAVSCFGGNNGSAMVVATGGTTPYNYLWNNGQITQTAQNIPAGPHTVTITDAQGCNAQVIVTVPEPFELTSIFSNVADDPCVGSCQGSATINPAGGSPPYSFSWSSPSITPGVQTATGLCPGTYTVTVQDANGCTNTQSQNIGSAPPIQVQFSPVSPTCVGQSDGSVGTTVTGGAAPYLYLWGTGSTAPNLQNASCGNHFLSITDAVGCTKTDTVFVDCPLGVMANIVNIQAVKCFGASDGTASAQAQGGTGPYSFVWSDQNNQTTQQASNLASGIYTVTVSDANACTATATVSIPQPGQLNSPISSVGIGCFNAATGTAMANPGGGTAPYTYIWSTGSTSQQLNNLSAGTYTVTVTDANNCTASSTANVMQPSQGIQLSVSQTFTPCFGGGNGQAAATASGNPGDTFNYAWSNGQQGSIANELAVGAYTVTVTDQSACSTTATISIVQFAPVLVNVAFVPPTCYNLPNGQAAVNMISGGAAMGDTMKYNYQWSVPGAPNVPFISGLLGDVTYQITATDFQGCSGTSSFFVNQPPAIILNTTVENILCFGGNNGAVDITSVQNMLQPIVYVWSNMSTSPKIENLSAGVYRVTLTDAEGCTAVGVYDLKEPESLSLSFQHTSLLCAGDSTASINTQVGGGTLDYTFLWSNGANSPNINQLGQGQYALTVTDKNGCTVSGVQNIAEPAALQLTTQLTEPECFGEHNGRIKVLVSGGNSPYRYSLNGGPFGGSSTFIALSAGIYSLQVRDANGCINTLVDTLGQPPAIQVFIGSDTSITLGDSLLLSATIANTIGMAQYQWSSALIDSFSCADPVFCDEIWVSPSLSNTYTLTVSDANGCAGVGTIRVRVEKPRGIHVPTAFSPNGDFINDLLVVHGLSKQVRNILVFRVYDRWGEMLYEDRNFTVNQNARGWDGSFRDQACDPGVYVWVLEAEYIDGFQEILKGNVTLIR